jgi:hypothetical protein
MQFYSVSVCVVEYIQQKKQLCVSCVVCRYSQETVDNTLVVSSSPRIQRSVTFLIAQVWCFLKFPTAIST